jgi:hypothetical protein
MKIISKAFPVNPIAGGMSSRNQFQFPCPLVGNPLLYATFSFASVTDGISAHSPLPASEAWLVVTVVDTEKCYMLDEIRAYEQIDRYTQDLLQTFRDFDARVAKKKASKKPKKTGKRKPTHKPR